VPPEPTPDSLPSDEDTGDEVTAGGDDSNPDAGAAEEGERDGASMLAAKLAAAGPTIEELAALPTAKAATFFFGALDKAIRGSRLYQGEGEVVRRMMTSMIDRGKALVMNGEVTVALRSMGLTFEGEPVTEVGTRIPYLFQLYCDGVREITLSPGLDAEQLEKLVDVLKTEQSKLEEEDLVTLLWRQDLENFRYYAVDSLGAGGESDDAGLTGKSRAQLDRNAQGGVELAMTSGDLRNLRTEDLMEWVREASCSSQPVDDEVRIAEYVRSRYTPQRDHARFLDVAVHAASKGKRGSSATMAVGVYDAALAAVDGDGVIAMLTWVADRLEREEPSIVSLRRALLDPARLARLGPVYVSRIDEMSPVLQRLVGVARESMVGLLTSMPPGSGEGGLQKMLGEAGVDLTDYYLTHLSDPKEEVILNAITALGNIGSPEAMRAVAQALASTLTKVRTAALAALHGKYDASYRVALGRVLRDPDKDNRVTALEILAGSDDRRNCWPILSIAQGAGFDRLAEDEQEAVYRALGAFKDNRNLEHFEKVLGNKSLVRNKAALGRQRMAVDAIVATGTPEAKALVEKYLGKWSVPSETKQALKSALSMWGAAHE
jgi:HEAT repeat protein